MYIYIYIYIYIYRVDSYMLTISLSFFAKIYLKLLQDNLSDS